MQTSRIARLLLISPLLLSGARTALDTTTFCRLEHLPLSYNGALGRVRQHSLLTGRISSGLINFQNNTALPITELMILVDYLNESHERLFTLVYHISAGSRPKMQTFFGRPVPMSVPALQRPLEPGKDVHISGNGIVTSGQCPAQARVTMVRVIFADDKSDTWSSSDWHLDAVLADVPDRLALPRNMVAERMEFLATAQISSDGKLEALIPSDTIRTDLADALRVQLSHWSFLPLLEGGKPAATKATLLFRFHPDPDAEDTNPFPIAKRADRPFIVVDLLSRGPSRDEWTVLAGR